MANETWASAGRLLQLIKGPFDATIEYHLLDIVFYIGSTYICKGDSLGNLPTDTTYFQLLAQGATDATASVYCGTCDTQADSPNKVVNVIAADNFVLKRGCIVGVNFTYTNTYEATISTAITLNVNGTGVYNISFNGSATPTGANKVAFGEANYTHYYMYDGYYWVFVGRSGVQTAEQTPLASPITVDGVSKSQVEETLTALNTLAASNKTTKQPKTLDTPLTIEGTSQTTTEGALGALNDYSEDIDAVISANGAKNLLYNPLASGSTNGLTYTVNSDGSISFNGTASANTWIELYNQSLSLKQGSYRLSGCPADGSSLTYNMYVWTSAGFEDFGEGVEFDVASDISNASVVIKVLSGTNMTGKVFKPMITLADQPNSDYAHYVPYAKTNIELTSKVDGMGNILKRNGAKNYNEYPYYETTETNNGITFTVNDDGTVTANGTATGGGATFQFRSRTASPLKLPTGEYILTGGYSANAYITLGKTVNNAWQNVVKSYGEHDNAQFSILSSDNIGLAIEVSTGTVLTNAVFKPMIRVAGDFDDTYEPYAKTNAQLTEDANKFSSYRGHKTSYESLEPGFWRLSSAQASVMTDKPSTYTDGVIYAIHSTDGSVCFVLVIDPHQRTTHIKYKYSTWSGWYLFTHT